MIMKMYQLMKSRGEYLKNFLMIIIFKVIEDHQKHMVYTITMN